MDVVHGAWKRKEDVLQLVCWGMFGFGYLKCPKRTTRCMWLASASFLSQSLVCFGFFYSVCAIISHMSTKEFDYAQSWRVSNYITLQRGAPRAKSWSLVFKLLMRGFVRKDVCKGFGWSDFSTLAFHSIMTLINHACARQLCWRC